MDLLSRRRFAVFGDWRLLLVLGAMLVALLLAVLTSPGTPAPTPSGQQAKRQFPVIHQAEWAWRPASVAEMSKGSEGAAQARVVAIEPGEPLRFDEPDHPGMRDIPTQVITFETENRWFGAIPERFQISKTGSDREWIEDDPPYAVGERYVMFLHRRLENGLYLNPVDGRLKVDGQQVRALTDGAIANDVQRLPLPTIRTVSTEARSGG